MKTNLYLALVSGACGLCLLTTTGCGKQDEAPAPATPSTNTSSTTSQARSAADSVAAQASQAAADAKAAADKTIAETQKTVGAATEQAAKTAESTIATVKQLINDKKYQEALTSLQHAAKLQLTPEQKKTVDDLLAQVQKLLATDAVKAIPGVPQPPQ
jgi:membrane-bound lytic murein transglycosylase